MGVFGQYLEAVQGFLSKVDETQIDKAARILAYTIKDDKLIHVLGTEAHSCMAVDDMFWRAGGLVQVKPVFASGLALSHGAQRSIVFERSEDYIKAVIEHEQLEPGDTLLIVSTFGISASAIEAAYKGKATGASVVAITSAASSKGIPANHPDRHHSGKNLYEIEELDAVIDNQVPVTDAVIKLDGLDVNVSPVSTILTSFILQALAGCTAEQLLSMGIAPRVWRSRSLAGGDEYNRKHIDKYSTVIKRL